MKSLLIFSLLFLSFQYAYANSIVFKNETNDWINVSFGCNSNDLSKIPWKNTNNPGNNCGTVMSPNSVNTAIIDKVSPGKYSLVYRIGENGYKQYTVDIAACENQTCNDNKDSVLSDFLNSQNQSLLSIRPLLNSCAIINPTLYGWKTEIKIPNPPYGCEPY
jgi:hypothetical protein